MMHLDEQEEKLLRSVALQNANAILLARERAERDLLAAKEALERKTQELAQSLAIMRATFSQAAVGMVIGTLEGRFEQMNEKFSSIVGYSPQELQQLTFVDITHPDDLAETREHIGRLVAGEFNEYSLDKRYVRKDRTDVWTRTTVTLLKDSEGRAQRFIGVIEDITDRKRSEEVRSRLAAVVESSDDAIISTTLDGIITTWNAGAQRMYGYSAHEVIGKPVTVLVPSHRADEEPAIVRRLIKGEHVDHYETERVRKDGTMLEVSLTVSPIRDSQGKLIGASKIARDITERKRALEALAQSERQLRLITDTAPALIGYVDSGYRYRFANRQYEFWFNLSREKVVGHQMSEVLGEEMFTRIKPHFDRAFAGEKVHIETEAPYRHGGIRSIEAFYIPDHDENRKVRGVFVLVMDVTDRKRSEQALEKAQKELSRHAEQLEAQVAQRTAHLNESIQSLEGVCYTIAHDLRAPLRAMQGFTKILLEDYAKGFDVEGQRLAHRIVNASTRMDVLIRDLLDYARLSHADIPCLDIDLQPLLRHVVDSLGHEITSKNATIEIQALPRVCGNPTIVQQIFTNLLSNSLKFVETGVSPKIEIWSEKGGYGRRVLIKDNGIGISGEHHERVFGMFQRLHSDEKEYPGTGVGLAIVKKAMERIGGRVGLETNVSPGACFYLDFQPASKEL